MNNERSVSQLSLFIVILEYIILDEIIAYYSLTNIIIVDELTMYEDKLALMLIKTALAPH